MMQPQQRRNTNVGVEIGILLQLAGFILLNQTASTAAMVGLVLILISLPPFIWGSMNYAAGKGHSTWVGLVGLAGIVGLIVLILLPDQHDQAPANRLQLRKVAGLISLVAGFGFVLLGVWLHQLGDDARLERLLGPWPGASMLFGACLVAGALVLIVDRGRD
jgi:hypothetical protein